MKKSGARKPIAKTKPVVKKKSVVKKKPVATAKPVVKAKAKTAGAKAPKRSVALTPNGQPMKGSAGPQILRDLKLTDAELAAFLPADAPRWLRGVLWCQFEGPASLAAIADHFASRFTVTRWFEKRFPPGAPDDGIEIATVRLEPKGKYVAYTFYGMRGEAYVEDGSWQLEATFRESGTTWGSNRAVYERFKAIELAGLGARSIVERTD